jgi:septation ring formation regulator EzrA
VSLIDDATTIGNVLTQIDTALQTPGLSDADWHTLYALRKHLDGLQRDLIRKSISEADQTYQKLTAQLKTASNQLTTFLGDLTKVQNAIATVAQIASYADQLLKMAGG